MLGVVGPFPAEAAGIDLSHYPRLNAELRGRDETISIYTLPDDANPMASSAADPEAETKKSA